MVRLPPEFVATKYSGYFWNTKTQTLFSVKVHGELKELVKPEPNFFNHYLEGYRVSVNGHHRILRTSYLLSLKDKDTEFPVWKEKVTA